MKQLTFIENARNSTVRALHLALVHSTEHDQKILRREIASLAGWLGVPCPPTDTAAALVNAALSRVGQLLRWAQLTARARPV